jgi:hypothetical protein
MPYLEKNQRSWRWVCVRMRLPDQAGDVSSRAVKLLTLQGFDIKVDPSFK